MSGFGHATSRLGAVLALALAFAAGPSAASAGAFALTGHWLGSNGNWLDLTQNGATIDWTSHSADGTSWVHDYTGTLSGADITGRFEDRPGYEVWQTGSISAHVTGDCSFRVTHVAVDGGQANDGGEVFTRTPCPVQTPTRARFHFGFRLSLLRVDLSAGSHGSFTTLGQPAADGTLVVRTVSAPRFKLSWRTRHHRYAVTFAFRGDGTYDPQGNDLYLGIAVKRSTIPSCRPSGHQGASIEFFDGEVHLSFCGELVRFPKPESATSWIRPA